jgi:hypothetical protein
LDLYSFGTSARKNSGKQTMQIIERPGSVTINADLVIHARMVGYLAGSPFVATGGVQSKQP